MFAFLNELPAQLSRWTPHPTLASNDAIDLRWTVMPPHPLVQECATAVASGIGSITSLGASPAQGVPELIDAICQHYNRRGLPTSPEQVVVTNGVISGLHLSLIAATRPGALVGVENPTYPKHPARGEHRTAAASPPSMSPAASRPR